MILSLTLSKRLPSYVWLLLLSSVFALAAQPEGASAKSSVSTKPSAKDYVLQPSDVIKVQIFQEDDLNRDVRISQECTVQLPLIERVDLTGKTARQAEDYIRALYAKDFIKNPQVNLSVMEYAPRRVNVIGAVNTQGVVVFQQEQGLTLLEAIGKAGGFSRLAAKKKVTLKRIKPDGTTDTTVINCEELAKGETNELWPLQPDDVIYVPEIIM